VFLNFLKEIESPNFFLNHLKTAYEPFTPN